MFMEQKERRIVTTPTLIVMAAGMGSRYGGLKQIEPVGPSREIILDYSVYDAIKAGFGRVVFVIKDEMQTMFSEHVGNHIATEIPVNYVYQRLEDIPEKFSLPAGRIKPWGTGHALYCCREAVREPFAVINADDFYGADAFKQVAGFLRNMSEDEKHHACMIGYNIENTLTDHGSVTRGICTESKEGYLVDITEHTRVERKNGEILDIDDGGSTVIAPGTVVSMNIWGFSRLIFDEVEQYLNNFLHKNQDSLESVEFYLPVFVNELLKDNKTDVKVLETKGKWFGITYRDDKAAIQEAIRDMVRDGKYPEKLWRSGIE
jgi:NDP-sugar pyrophosphorylase family protein